MSVYLWLWLMVIFIGLTVLGLYGIKYWLESEERARMEKYEQDQLDRAAKGDGKQPLRLF